MANERVIRIAQVVASGTPSSSSLLLYDDGSTMRKTQASDAADAIRPVASEGEAQAGSDNAKTMTALRTKQSIASEVGVSVASKAQGDLANTAVQPAALDDYTKTADLSTVATSGDYDDLTNKPSLGNSSALNVGTTAGTVAAGDDTRIVNATPNTRQITAGTGITGGGDLTADRTIALNGASIASLLLADSAVQPGDLALVATTGVYNDLFGKPTLGTAAAAAATDFATAAQAVPAGGAVGQVLSKTSAADNVVGWTTPAGSGDMLEVVYDPAGIEANAFNGFPVASRTVLKALDTTKFTTVYLTEPGREGQFVWRAGDYSARVSSDTTEAIYIKANDTAAASGAWVRAGDWRTHGVDILWFGAVVYPDQISVQTGTPAQSAIQAAVNIDAVTTIRIPAGFVRLTAGIEITRAKRFVGTGWSPYVDVTQSPRTVGPGSYIYIDGFTDKPAFDFYSVNLTTNQLTGGGISNLGMLWNQPNPSGTPSTAWTPTNYDYAIRCYGTSDQHFENILLLNATRGVLIDGDVDNPCGRQTIRDFYGQIFNIGIDVNFSVDVNVQDRVHLWPFWSTNSNVIDYQVANTIGIRFGRADNSQSSNLFFIYHAVNILFDGGVSNRTKIVNAGFDGAVHGIRFSSSSSGSTLQIADAYHVGDGHFLLMEGNSSRVVGVNIESSDSQTHAINLTGTGNVVTLSNLEIPFWNQSASSFSAISATAGNNVIINGAYFGTTSGNAKTDGPVLVFGDHYNPWIPPTLLNGWVNYGGGYEFAGYRKEGGTVHIRGFIGGGTAADNTVLFTLPAGYRPAATRAFPTVNTVGGAWIEVRNNGDVVVSGSAGASYIGLEGVSFNVPGT